MHFSSSQRHHRDVHKPSEMTGQSQSVRGPKRHRFPSFGSSLSHWISALRQRFLCARVRAHSQRPRCDIRWFTKDESSSTWRNAEAKCSISYAVNLGNLTVRCSGRWKTWSSITQIPGALLGRTRRKSSLCFNLASMVWKMSLGCGWYNKNTNTWEDVYFH